MNFKLKKTWIVTGAVILFIVLSSVIYRMLNPLPEMIITMPPSPVGFNSPVVSPQTSPEVEETLTPSSSPSSTIVSSLKPYSSMWEGYPDLKAEIDNLSANEDCDGLDEISYNVNSSRIQSYIYDEMDELGCEY